MKQDISRLARRSFLSKIGVGATAFGGAFVAGVQPAEAQSFTGSGRWQPTSHLEDDWLDRVSAKHRMFFDTTKADGLGEALLFVNNYFNVNKNAYSLEDNELAVVLCVRHKSTPFAFTDAIWAKYAEPIAERAGFMDPKTKRPATLNVYQATGYDGLLLNNGITLDALLTRGLRLAVCAMSTRNYAVAIAAKTSAKVEDIFTELTGHLVPNAHVVPAGIVAVNRAQERGYSIAYAS